MRTLLSVAAGLLGLAVVTPAGAADLALPDKVPPPSAGFWSGFYIGVNGGGGFGHTDLTGNNALGGALTNSFTGNYNTSGVFAGGQFGVQYQFPSNVVLGFEANIDGSDIKGSKAFCISAGNCQSTDYDLWSFSTIEGRLGYAFSNVLLYGTGGGVTGNSRSHSTLTSSVPGAGLAGSFGTDNAEPMGWSAGAGIEWAFFPNWTVKVEYKHLAFINDTLQTYNYGLVAGTTPFVGQAWQNASIDTVRVGVNYLFHWNTPGAVVAKY